MRPLIAISCNVLKRDPQRAYYRDKELHYVEASMTEAVTRAGGVPTLLPTPRTGEADVESMGHFDALVLSSGLDVNPEFSGCTPPPAFDNWSETAERDRFEISLVHRFLELGRPILGVCRGPQIINVALGGTLLADLPEGQSPSHYLRHRDPETYDNNRHEVTLESGSVLASVLRRRSYQVVSVHHQAIDRLGEGLRVCARAADGVIEAVEMNCGSFVMGVQWHPEWMPGEEAGDKPFLAFVQAAAGKSRERADR